ncbi:hypothetical protein ADT25_17600 [Xanthomonas oryzae]|uniref:Uncharacterized protein n=1 Tax=Xanthomonas oryzae TaxID=347 RepID=A0AAP1EWY9_9XANT|nr:hypothetical protein [Xanthomonas oryzae]KOR41319.1 hypothetical protein ADT25_17600 [Xanthomonas oryzae]
MIWKDEMWGNLRDRMIGAFIDQFRIADVHPAVAPHATVAAVQAIVQNPRQVIAMDNAPDQAFLWV